MTFGFKLVLALAVVIGNSAYLTCKCGKETAEVPAATAGCPLCHANSAAPHRPPRECCCAKCRVSAVLSQRLLIAHDDRLPTWEWRETASATAPHILGTERSVRLPAECLAFYDVASSRSLATSFRHLLI